MLIRCSRGFGNKATASKWWPLPRLETSSAPIVNMCNFYPWMPAQHGIINQWGCITEDPRAPGSSRGLNNGQWGSDGRGCGGIWQRERKRERVFLGGCHHCCVQHTKLWFTTGRHPGGSRAKKEALIELLHKDTDI